MRKCLPWQSVQTVAHGIFIILFVVSVGITGENWQLIKALHDKIEFPILYKRP